MEDQGQQAQASLYGTLHHVHTQLTEVLAFIDETLQQVAGPTPLPEPEKEPTAAKPGCLAETLARCEHLAQEAVHKARRLRNLIGDGPN